MAVVADDLPRGSVQVGDWAAVPDEASGAFYFVHMHTGDTTWDDPQPGAWPAAMRGADGVVKMSPRVRDPPPPARPPPCN